MPGDRSFETPSCWALYVFIEICPSINFTCAFGEHEAFLEALLADSCPQAILWRVSNAALCALGMFKATHDWWIWSTGRST